jgi:ubiquitin C-terminal hydrolase
MHIYGLLNIGNTCFLNTFIQIFYQIWELQPIYDTCFPEFAKPDLVETQFIQEWIELQQFIVQCLNDTQIENGPPTIRPAKFIQSLHVFSQHKNNDQFSNFCQNDFTEFMMLFLQAFHTSICRKQSFPLYRPRYVLETEEKLNYDCLKYLKGEIEREYSEITDLFFSVQVNFLHSFENRAIELSHNPELCFPIDLPIPEHPSKNGTSITIYDCLNEYIKGDMLVGDNSLWNERTGRKENAVKTTMFWKLANILIFSLKRVSPCGNKKRNELVDFPLEDLDMSPYLCAGGWGRTSNNKYQLFAICFHYGGFMGGHYNACLLNPDTKEWIGLDDDNITRPVDLNQYKSNAYCLFYRKNEY